MGIKLKTLIEDTSHQFERNLSLIDLANLVSDYYHPDVLIVPRRIARLEGHKAAFRYFGWTIAAYYVCCNHHPSIISCFRMALVLTQLVSPGMRGRRAERPKSIKGKITMKNRILCSALFLLVSSIGASAEETRPIVDATARTAIISAYEPEWVELRAALHDSKQYIIGRTTFLTGTIEDKPVLLFLSGISMVNAALTSQLAIDRFNVSRIVFSGIAGGVDSERSIGDVVVPSQWSEYLESAFARETKEGYALPSFESKAVKNFGMIFPQPVQIASPSAETEKLQWFPTDSKLLALARKVADAVHLDSCTVDKTCLAQQPKVVIGGNGVSGQVFVDNRIFREYVRSAFKAEVVDMESAAIAHVAYINNRPFIAFRSLSDLAGADPDQTQEDVFEKLASKNSAMVVKAFVKELP